MKAGYTPKADLGCLCSKKEKLAIATEKIKSHPCLFDCFCLRNVINAFFVCFGTFDRVLSVGVCLDSWGKMRSCVILGKIEESSV